MKPAAVWRRLCVVLVALSAMTLGLTAPASASGDTGAVAGRLTTGDDTGAGSVPVDVYSADDFNWVGSAITDSTGAYRVDGLLTGSYLVRFSAGDVTQWAYAMPSPFDADRITVVAGQVATVNDTVVEPGSITGQVLDVNGAPATNYPVYAEPVEAAGEWAHIYTDETGRYAFHGLWPGEYRLAFRTPEGLRQYAPQKLTEADAGRFTVGPGDALVVDEQILPHGWITGRVSDAGGAPLAHAQVNAAGPGSYLWADADSDGRFRMAAWPGTYTVNFATFDRSRSQYFFGARERADAAAILVQAGQETFLEDSLLPTGSVRLTAIDAASGEPIPDFCASVGANTACSGGTGELVLTDIVIGANSVNVTAQGYEYGRLDVEVTAGQTATATIALVRRSTIVTTVRDAETGDPVAGVCVYPQRANGRRLTRGTPPGCSDAQGRLVIEYVEPDTGYVLYVSAPRGSGYGDQWLGHGGGTGDRSEAHMVRTVQGAEVEAPPIKLDRAGTITGVVTDATTGRPLPDADVTLSSFHPGYGVDFGVVTDASGRYRYEKLGPYNWRLFIAGDGYAPRWSGGTPDVRRAEKIKVRPGGTSTHDVALTTGTTVTGTVAGAVECWVVARNVETGDTVGWGWFEQEGYTLHVLGQQQIRLHCRDRSSEIVSVTGEESLTVDFS